MPTTIAREVIELVGECDSAVIRLARVVQMPSGVESIPVVSAAPVSGRVEPAHGGLKPAGAIDWGLATLTAEELATIVGIPNEFIDDTTFPVSRTVIDDISALGRPRADFDC